MFPFPVVDVPVPLVAGILLFPLVAGDTTARGRANASWRELQLPPRGRAAAAATSLSAWRGRLVSASVPVVDVPVPPRGGGYDRSRTRKRVPAGVTTPSARAHRRRDALGQAVRGDRVSRSAPGDDVPLPARGCPRSPSWRGIRPLADAQTSPGGSYNSLREGTLPPRGHTSAARAHRLHEGTPPPRGHTAAAGSLGTQCAGTRLGRQSDATA